MLDACCDFAYKQALMSYDGGAERRFDGSASLVVKAIRHDGLFKLPVRTRNYE